MKQTKRPVNIHQAYHAHVYFNETTKSYAKLLCNTVSEKFNLKVGRFHEKLVGPHPQWSCQISFNHDDFDTLIPWLDEHKQELTIFVHGLTGNDLNDHTNYAYWLGEEDKLNISQFL